MLTEKQMADRLALIKKVAKRRDTMAKVKAKSARVIDTVKPQPRKMPEIDIPRESNIYRYTDESKYAAQYYGETMYHTTKFDNDWD